MQPLIFYWAQWHAIQGTGSHVRLGRCRTHCKYFIFCLLAFVGMQLLPHGLETWFSWKSCNKVIQVAQKPCKHSTSNHASLQLKSLTHQELRVGWGVGWGGVMVRGWGTRCCDQKTAVRRPGNQLTWRKIFSYQTQNRIWLKEGKIDAEVRNQD